ncbi:MAG: sugar phosphate nucleotidyltransferase, partial [Nocardioidaceae bacterium]
MESVIVAGGKGSRLRPLTERRPKHLLPVAGVPFVAHQLSKLAAAGVERVVLATSYHAEDFAPVLGDGSQWGIELVYVTEEEPLGTGGAIRNVGDCLRSGPDEPVVVMNGDILSGHDIAAQVEYHLAQHADVTLHLVEVGDARAYGCVPTGDEGRVLEFTEKSPDPVSRQVNAGCYVFRRGVIDEIPAGRAVSVERETFPALLERRRLVGFVRPDYWIDLGTPEALVRGSSDLVRGIATSPAYPHPPAEAWLAPDAYVSRESSVRGGSAVGAGAVVDAGAVVESSVICAGAVVGERARVVASVVGPGSRVGADVTLRGAVIGDDAVVGAGCELVGGAR